MDDSLKGILAAGAKKEIDESEVGEKVYLAGNTSGRAKESWDVIRHNKVFSGNHLALFTGALLILGNLRTPYLFINTLLWISSDFKEIYQ